MPENQKSRGLGRGREERAASKIESSSPDSAPEVAGIPETTEGSQKEGKAFHTGQARLGVRSSQSLTVLKSVGPKRMALLRKLGLETLGDLLFHLPRRYEDWTCLRPVASLCAGETQTCLVVCQSVAPVARKGRLTWIKTLFADATGTCAAVFFNQPYLQDVLEEGRLYLLNGTPVRKGWSLEWQNPSFVPVPLLMLEPGSTEEPRMTSWRASAVSPECLRAGFVRPVYRSTAALGQTVLRGLMRQALDLLQEEIRDEDPLPVAICQRQGLISRVQALETIHFPKDFEAYQQARKRLVFEEWFFVQLGLRALKEGERAGKPAPILDPGQAGRAAKQLIQDLPFALTSAQNRALDEVLHDLSLGRPMNRMLQGDVGSGKTAVAGLALAVVAQCGYQGLLLAPTSILARQHAQTFEKLFAKQGIRIGLLTGSTPARERRALLEAFACGTVSILVGTHALLHPDVRFAHPGLVVTDEQHRFGVQQRLSLLKAQDNCIPHVLVMSATPIPRSLALVLHGDLALSILDEKPVGRLPIETYTVRTDDLPRALAHIDKHHLSRGGQAYVVCARKEDAEGELFSVEEVRDALQTDWLPHRSCSILHGDQKESEKSQVMEAFARGEVEVLVSTTVVEVGVDNPKATAMLILDADRFGLSQLHQLRGRVGRGAEKSLCLLHSDCGEGEARQRLRALCQTEDGFQLAELDLELRGPGDFFGTRQHGLPELRLANLYTDREILLAASEEAQRWQTDRIHLECGEEAKLRAAIQTYLGDLAENIGL